MKGRPSKSRIRNNILEILDAKKKAYGYEIYQNYLKIFPKVHIRSIYYHLKKGVMLKEITLRGTRKEKGKYSWGSTAEKVYYTLGPRAHMKAEKKVNTHFNGHKRI
jgi:hypothetical protein